MIINIKNIYPPRIIVKFSNEVNLPYTKEVNEKIDLPFWIRVKARYPHITIEPLITSITVEKIKKLYYLAKKINPSYEPPNFLTYFAIDTKGRNTNEILRRLSSNFDEVDYFYLEPIPSRKLEPGKAKVFPLKRNRNPSSFKQQEKFINKRNMTTFGADTTIEQKYTKCSPMGIGVENISELLTRRGDAIDIPDNHFFDLERGWVLEHKDLQLDNFGTLIIPENEEVQHMPSDELLEVLHGTSTLGVVSSIHNSFGAKGVAYYATIPHAVSTYVMDLNQEKLLYSVENSIFSTLCFLLDRYEVGELNAFSCSILLIEEHLKFGGKDEIAVETVPAIFDAIEFATSLGVSVIEAAGNGGYDLDSLENGVFDKFLSKDSGALIVGSAKCNNIQRVTKCNDESIRWLREVNSCFGSKVNCFAWGSDVDTLATKAIPSTDPFDGREFTFHDDQYRKDFGGTSSAAAIIAGAALITQKMAYITQGNYLSPYALRELLGNPAHGVLNTDSNTYLIGVMPNLESIAIAWGIKGT